MMGVIPINFSPDVEVWIKGTRAGTRSAIVNQVMKKHIQSKLSDVTADLVQDCSIQKLTMHCVNRCSHIDEFDKEWFDRAMILRDVFLAHLEAKA